MALVDFFLKLNGIEGESQDDKHKNEIELESWSWSEQQAGTGHSGGGHGAGKVAGGDFHFTMKVNKASPKLFLACANGEHITDAKLVARKAGTEQMEFMTVTFTGLLVSSFQMGGSGHGDVLPIDQCSINFKKMEYEYKVQNKDGTPGGATKAGYNFETNKKV